jgi:hypothetical protein
MEKELEEHVQEEDSDKVLVLGRAGPKLVEVSNEAAEEADDGKFGFGNNVNNPPQPQPPNGCASDATCDGVDVEF